MSALPAAVALFLLCARRRSWPMSAWPTAYLGIGGAGLAVYLWLWSLVANLSDAGAFPLPYLPIANPLELAQGLALATVAGWLVFLQRDAPRSGVCPMMPLTWPAVVFALFAGVTAVLLRFIHHYLGIEYQADALMAFDRRAVGAVDFLGTRRARRPWWSAPQRAGGSSGSRVPPARRGAAQRCSSWTCPAPATVARIVSFIGVGVLMLIIGRFSPVPPAAPEDGVMWRARIDLLAGLLLAIVVAVSCASTARASDARRVRLGDAD